MLRDSLMERSVVSLSDSRCGRDKAERAQGYSRPSAGTVSFLPGTQSVVPFQTMTDWTERLYGLRPSTSSVFLFSFSSTRFHASFVKREITD